MRSRLFVVLAVAITVMALGVSAQAGTLAGSKHDLRSTGASAYKGTSDEICLYCHSPHNGSTIAPLWSHQLSAAGGYQAYTSTTMSAASNYTSGVSAACLSCHDGTLATGNLLATVNGGVDIGGIVLGASTANLGTDFRNDHPVGISMTTAAVGDPTMNGAPTDPTVVRTFINGAITDAVECASCHRVHDNTIAFFLVKSNAGSAICISCHAK